MRTIPPLKTGQIRLKYNNAYVGSTTELGNGMPVTVNNTNKKIEPITGAATRNRDFSSTVNSGASLTHNIIQDPSTGVYLFLYTVNNYPYIKAGRVKSRNTGDYWEFGTAVQINLSLIHI